MIVETDDVIFVGNEDDDDETEINTHNDNDFVLDIDRCFPIEPIVVAGKYAILRSLGKGQFGSVYLGQHIRPFHKGKHREFVAHEFVAMKLEAKTCPHAILKHESALLHYLYTKSCCRIPLVHWFGFSPELNANVLIQPYYPFSVEDGLLSFEEREGEGEGAEKRQNEFIRRFVLPANRILKQLHSLGVVHRDIKPSNWMFDGKRELVLIDFGLATFYETLSSPHDDIIGSPNYVSWFVHQGQPFRPRDDLLSLLYVCLDLLLHSVDNDHHKKPLWEQTQQRMEWTTNIHHPQNIQLRECKHPHRVLPRIPPFLQPWATHLYSSSSSSSSYNSNIYFIHG